MPYALIIAIGGGIVALVIGASMWAGPGGALMALGACGIFGGGLFIATAR